MNMRRLLLSLSLLAACQDQQVVPAPRFRGPQDMIAAGPPNSRGEPRYLFVAGSERDAVYAVDLDSPNLSFVRAPNRFFPLEIPVGGAPTSLSSSADARVLLVACPGDASVWIIDAVTLRLIRDADGAPLRMPVGRGATQILRAPTPTASGDRFYVTAAADGAVNVFDLSYVEAEGGLSVTLTPQPTIANVGSLSHSVLSRDGLSLYGADTSSAFVHRVRLDTATVSDFDVGGPSLDVALTRGDAVLLVARPDTLSVEALNADTGARLDTDPIYAPRLLDSQTFEGIYIGDVPTRLFAVETPGIDLAVHCPGTEEVPRTSSFTMVATQSGIVYFIDSAQNTIVNERFCQGPQVVPLSQSPNLFVDSPFVACPAQLPRRMVCDPQSGITVFPGTTTASNYALEYEGLLLRRTEGGGTLQASTRLIDPNIDLAAVGITTGDRLIITSGPKIARGDCVATYGGPEDVRLRDFAITSLGAGDDGVLGLDFDPPLDLDCFEFDTSGVRYEIRVGGAFLLTGVFDATAAVALGRLRPGDSYGYGLEPIRFTLRSDLAPDRGEVYAFGVNVPFKTLAGGLARVQDQAQSVDVSLGRVPSAISIGRAALGDWELRAFVAFSGNDTVVSFMPTDSLLINSEPVAIR